MWFMWLFAVAIPLGVIHAIATGEISTGRYSIFILTFEEKPIEFAILIIALCMMEFFLVTVLLRMGREDQTSYSRRQRGRKRRPTDRSEYAVAEGEIRATRFHRSSRSAMTRAIHTVVALVIVSAIGSAILGTTAGLRSDPDSRRAEASYVTANGRPASLTDYRGQYLWVDHAAEWCGYCAPQTRTIKALEQRYGEKLVFVTVVAGTDKVMQEPGADTARAWAERFGLNPDRVLARFSTDKLPYHVLYSPNGEVLFRDSGLYDADRIIGVLRGKTPVLN